MSKNVNFLDTMVLIENIFGIYRNYNVLSRTAKMLATLRIIVEMMISVTITFRHIHGLLSGLFNREGFINIPVTFEIFSILNTIITMFFGRYHSKSYICLKKNIHYVHQIYYRTDLLKNMLNFMKLMWIILGCLYIISRVVLTCTVNSNLARHLEKTKNVNIVSFYIGAVYETWVRSRWLLEFFVFCSMTYLVGSLFKLLNESVVRNLKEIEENIDWKKNIGVIKVNTIKEWVDVYRHLLKSCKELNICFAQQMLTSFGLALCYSIIVSYRLANMLIKQAHYELFGGPQMMFSFCYHLVAIVPIMVAGQRLNNQFISLRISLAKMNNLLVMIPGSQEYKEVKDFLQFLKLNPLEFKLMSLPIGMAMLPSSISVVVSYVVIALQFNHVV